MKKKTHVFKVSALYFFQKLEKNLMVFNKTCCVYPTVHQLVKISVVITCLLFYFSIFKSLRQFFLASIVIIVIIFNKVFKLYLNDTFFLYFCLQNSRSSHSFLYSIKKVIFLITTSVSKE